MPQKISPVAKETYRFLKDHMERTYNECSSNEIQNVNRESIFKIHIAWLSIGIWNDNSQYELKLGELFGLFMLLYDAWVQSERHLSDQDLWEYIVDIFFKAKEIFDENIDDKIPFYLGQLVCDEGESVVKQTFWGTWIVKMSASQEFPCKLVE